ncbi:MAG: HAD family phosphatase [Parvularculaceae bacterium]
MQILLFDLGGVVVDYRGPERLAALSGGRLSLDDARAALSSDILHAFERGEVSELTFGEAMVRDCGLDLTPSAFIAEFETWPERFLPGAAALIESLKGRYGLACLSNINEPHWRRCHALDLPRLFDAHFLSHEMGARKPEPEIYDAVIASLGAPAADFVFFDDVETNIAAAKAHGMSAFHVSPDRGLSGAITDARIS